MQLQQLIYFVTVAELGSMNKAAEKLYVTQPNLSKAISSLENELKVQIFERTNRGVELTEDGKKLNRYALAILKQVELIEGMAGQEAPRTLSIASYPIITMGRLVAEFYNRHKSEDITIRLVERRLQQIIEMVETRDAEIGFVMSNSVQNKELRSTLKFKGLEFTPIGEDTWYCNVGPNHPLYERDEINVREMLPFPFVRLPDDYFSNLTHYLEIDGIQLSNFNRTVHLSESAAIIRMLQDTDAVRFGPGLSRLDFECYGIRSIPITNCKISITAGWIKRKKENLSRDAEEFVALLQGLYPLNR